MTYSATQYRLGLSNEILGVIAAQDAAKLPEVKFKYPKTGLKLACQTFLLI